MPSSNIYLGSNQILEAQGSRRMYLGTQLICKAYLGSNLVFDNCGFVPVAVTLQVTNNISGPSAGYSIGGNTSGSVQSGQAGTQGYSFTTTASSNTGYTFTSGPSFSPTQPNAGNYPTVNSTVYTTITGTIQQNQQPTFTDTYVAATDSGLSSGSTSVTVPSGGNSITGVQGATSEATWTFTGSSSYTYTDMQINEGGTLYSMSGGPNSYTYTYTNTGNTISSLDRTITGTVQGTQTLNTSNHVINLSQVIGGLGASYTNTTYTISGSNITATSGSLTGNLNSGSVTVEINGTGTATITISSSSDGGYYLIDNNSTSTTITVGTGSPTNLTFNNTTIETANTSYGTGPYLSLSSAQSGGGSSMTFEYNGGDEGVLPSYGTRIYTSWIPANYPNVFSGELTNYRWYTTTDQQDSNGNDIVFYYFNGIQAP